MGVLLAELWRLPDGKRNFFRHIECDAGMVQLRRSCFVLSENCIYRIDADIAATANTERGAMIGLAGFVFMAFGDGDIAATGQLIMTGLNRHKLEVEAEYDH